MPEPSDDTTPAIFHDPVTAAAAAAIIKAGLARKAAREAAEAGQAAS